MRTVLAAALAAALLTTPAWGHAGVKSYSPKRNSTVPRSLSAVSVTFKARVGQARLSVRGPAGTVSRGTGTLVDGRRTVRVALRSGLRAGRYTASVRWLNTDGHVQRTSWTFRVR